MDEPLLQNLEQDCVEEIQKEIVDQITTYVQLYNKIDPQKSAAQGLLGSGQGLPGEHLIRIYLNIQQENFVLKDSFDWDLAHHENNPEDFAEQMIQDLNLPQSFKYQIAYEIRKQIQDHVFSLYNILNDSLKCEFTPAQKVQVQNIDFDYLPFISPKRLIPGEPPFKRLVAKRQTPATHTEVKPQQVNQVRLDSILSSNHAMGQKQMQEIQMDSQYYQQRIQQHSSRDLQASTFSPVQQKYQNFMNSSNSMGNLPQSLMYKSNMMRPQNNLAAQIQHSQMQQQSQIQKQLQQQQYDQPLSLQQHQQYGNLKQNPQYSSSMSQQSISQQGMMSNFQSQSMPYSLQPNYQSSQQPFSSLQNDFSTDLGYLNSYQTGKQGSSLQGFNDQQDEDKFLQFDS